MRTLTTLALLTTLLLAIPLLGQAPASGPATQPVVKEALTATLVAKKDSYTLTADYAGKAFRDRVAQAQPEGKELPAVQKVDFVLRITNNTDAPIVLMIGGDQSRIELTLAGDGALNVDNPVMMTMDYRMGAAKTIAPGKALELPITSLASGARGVSNHAYFTEAGEHTLTAKLTTQREGDDQQTELKTEPVKFKVVKQ
jgi:hypothetical protein